jgi:hypothetical protein
MRVYLALTAVVFALLTVLHIWRIFAESTALAREPHFVILTIISAALCIWAVRLLLVGRRPAS